MKIQKIRDVVVLRLSSDDLSNPNATSEIVEGLLKVDGERKFVVDLSAVPIAISLQVGTLVTLHLLCYENLAVMKLASVNEKVKVVLRLIGLDQLMEIHHGEGIARASFGPPTGNPPVTGGTPLHAQTAQRKPKRA